MTDTNSNNPTPFRIGTEACSSNPHDFASQNLTAKLEQLNLYTSNSQDSTKSAQSHHLSASGCPFLKTNFGVTYADDDNSLKAGERGPVLLEDFVFREKIMHFDHERIPERVVHARGTGAHGYFQVYESQAEFTKAAFLCDPSVKTPVFVRFSTVLGSRGSMDTARDIRGFATKFYTTEGNFDLVGNNIPVFFIQDAIKFPDIIHAGKPDPKCEIPQAQTAHTNFWDFISWTPEAMHVIMWAMSDRAIPRSYRTMQGFGVHTFALVNAEGKRTFVKFHWRPVLGIHSLHWDECQKLGGADPDFHRRDLYEAIGAGSYPEYELGLQLVKEEDEHKFDFDLLDATKIIPEDLVPIRWVGKMTLTETPSDFFTQTEQVAFCTQHVVPGIDFTDDPLLQGRNFSYLDTQLTRLGGPNFMEIPINRPICPVVNNQRDGFMRTTISNDAVNYFPNRFHMPKDTKSATKEELETKKKEVANAFVTYKEKIAGLKMRMKSPKFLDHYSQAILFYNSLTKIEQQHLQSACCFELSRCDDLGVRQRMIDHFNHIDHHLAVMVARKIGVEPPSASKVVEAKNNGLTASKFLSQIPTVSPYSSPITISTRKIAFLVADGYNINQLTAFKIALMNNNAIPCFIGPRKGPIYGKGASSKGVEKDQDDCGSAASDPMDGRYVTAVFTYFNSKSVLFDALVCLEHDEAGLASMKEGGDCPTFVCEAMKHCKAICAVGNGISHVEYACMRAGIKIAKQGDAQTVNDQGVVTCGQFTAPSALKHIVKKAVTKVGEAVEHAVSSATSSHTGSSPSSAVSAPQLVTTGNDTIDGFLKNVAMHRYWERNSDPIPY